MSLNWFCHHLGEKIFMGSQNPICLGDHSEPQPDLVLLCPQENFYADRLPEAKDILLLIEVADSSLTYDQTVKVPLYAHYQIPEIWLINLTQNHLDRYLDPNQNSYQTQTQFSPSQAIAPLAFPELELCLTRLFT